MRPARILLLGASGMLGSRFASQFLGRDVVTLDRALLDVTQPRQLIEAVMETQASIIINCVINGINR